MYDAVYNDKLEEYERNAQEEIVIFEYKFKR